LHVDALLDAVDLLLEGRRDGSLDVGGARADERRRDLHHRRDDFGVLRDRQPLHRHEAEHHHDDGQHHRHDGPVDEETGHAYRSPAAGAGSGSPLPSGDGGAGLAFTTMPSRSRCRPATTTRSLPSSPPSTTQRLPTRVPTVTVLKVTLLSPPTTATLYRFCSSCTARCGTSNAPFFVSMTKRARPYCPGRTSPPGFGNRNCTVSVPVVASTARSMASSLPFCGRTVPSARTRSIGIASPPRSLRSCAAMRASRRYSASARPARKRIGSISDTVVSRVLSPRPTRLPAFTSVVPTSPSRGEITVA